MKNIGAIRSTSLVSAVLFAFLACFCLVPGNAYAASEQEPNDSFASATRMSMGTTMYGCMYDTYATQSNWQSDDDFYRLVVPATGSVKITVQRTAFAESWTELNLYDSNYSYIGYIIGSKTLAPSSKTFSLKKGTYYLQMDMWCGASMGPYTLSATYVITAPSITKLTSKKTSIAAKWGKVSATGYQIKYSTKKSMAGAKVKTVKGSVKSKTITKLKKNKRYYVKVRAYKVIDGKTYYSSWSAKKSIKTKK